MTVRRGELRRLAQDSLGLESWLPGQEAALRALAEGRDTLALLPTGGGKSAIYQLAGVIRPGPTVVVSPLVALQQDQLRALREAEVGEAAALNASVPPAEREDILRQFREGGLEFLLLAPEQLANDALLEALEAGRPSLFVVDEAHCVSEWGPDFRPEYRRLGAVADRLGRPPMLGLTATASPAVREEMVTWLGLRDPAIVARGFDRPNLDLSVEQHADPSAKRRALLDWVNAAAGAGIVYVAARRTAESVAEELRARGVTAAAYHAGLGRRQRTDAQTAFMDASIRVIVATIAFGMGIDKPDVRFVAHHDVSDSLDAYYQEIGRAGRDGQPATARLWFRPEDLGLRRFQGAPAVVATADVRAVLRALRARSGDVDDIAQRSRRSRRRVQAVVMGLERLEAASVEPDGLVRLVEDGAPGDPAGLAGEVVDGQERRRRLAASRVEMLRGYAETEGCRRRFLLNYFGEEYEPPCDACDRCRAAAAAGLEAPAPDVVAQRPFRLDDPVVHVRFGQGRVSRIEGDRLTVRFDDVGYRTLDLERVLEDGLLSPASG